MGPLRVGLLLGVGFVSPFSPEVVAAAGNRPPCNGRGLSFSAAFFRPGVRPPPRSLVCPPPFDMLLERVSWLDQNRIQETEGGIRLRV